MNKVTFALLDITSWDTLFPIIWKVNELQLEPQNSFGSAQGGMTDCQASFTSKLCIFPNRTGQGRRWDVSLMKGCLTGQSVHLAPCLVLPRPTFCHGVRIYTVALTYVCSLNHSLTFRCTICNSKDSDGNVEFHNLAGWRLLSIMTPVGGLLEHCSVWFDYEPLQDSVTIHWLLIKPTRRSHAASGRGHVDVYGLQSVPVFVQF